MLETKTILRRNIKPYHDTLYTFDLPTLIETMKHKQTWADRNLNAMVLLKSPSKKIVLTVLHEGTVVKSFQSDDSVTLQIIEGKLKFHTRKESVVLEKGQLLTLHENIKYSLASNEDTVFLLTITNRVITTGDELEVPISIQY